MGVTAKKFGNLTSGEEITLYHLENKSGAYAEVMDYGAILVKLCVPDKDGELTDVVLGYDDVQQYEVNGCFFGAIIGRSGNRIAGARFSLYGQEYQLDKNENDNNLHSGPNGFEKKIWTVKNTDSDKNAITFSQDQPGWREWISRNSRCLLHMNLQRTIPCRFTIVESVTRRHWQI
ncbi:MAG: hypothetical protein ACLR7W_15930 [Ruminococcus sp.]